MLTNPLKSMTTKSKRILITIAASVLIGAVGWLILRPKKMDGGDFLEQVRNKHKNTFDNINKSIQEENQLIEKIEASILKNDSITALALIDTLIVWNKINTAYLYKGMLYEKQNKYLQAINEYTKAIEKEDFPLALGKRGEVYIKLNKIDKALNDYKKAFEWNYDYSLQIANVYEIKKIKDSALKYYTIFFKHYPNNQIVEKKIKSLQ